MDKKLQIEVKNLQKIGFPEDLAMLCGAVKTGNEEVAYSVLNDLNDEQDTLKQSLKFFKPFSPLCIEPSEIKKADENIFVEVNQITQETKIYKLPHHKRIEDQLKHLDASNNELGSGI